MSTTKKPKIKKIEPYTPAWERLANEVARGFVIIEVCRDCGGPVNKGYCCERCGSNNP